MKKSSQKSSESSIKNQKNQKNKKHTDQTYMVLCSSCKDNITFFNGQECKTCPCCGMINYESKNF